MRKNNRFRRIGGGILDVMHSAMAPPFSRLFLVDDQVNWSLSWDMREVGNIARAIGIRVCAARQLVGLRRQAIFHASQFVLLQPSRLKTSNRVGFAYFHGKPSREEPEFTSYYDALRRHHPSIHRVQVTNTAMRALLLESGIAPEKVFLIPIGINLDYFRQVQTPDSKRAARERYDLPQAAVIIGSFQKDGVGWGDGLEPKRVKGPDLFLQVIERLKPRVPELFVLLSGPSRGYVRRGLDRLEVPYRYIYYEDYRQIGRLYQALDLYLVTSREEGGPKAVLESMACGIPLVTTRVGQAADLARHGHNAWVVEVEDVEGLAHWAMFAIAHRDVPEVQQMLHHGRMTAEDNAYEAQRPLWRSFMQGFVECDHA